MLPRLSVIDLARVDWVKIFVAYIIMVLAVWDAHVMGIGIEPELKHCNDHSIIVMLAYQNSKFYNNQ